MLIDPDYLPFYVDFEPSNARVEVIG